MRPDPADVFDCGCDYHDGWHGCLMGNQALVMCLRSDRDHLAAALARAAREVVEHNSEYDHRTPDETIAGWHKLLMRNGRR